MTMTESLGSTFEIATPGSDTVPPLYGYVFDRAGKLAEKVEAKEGTLSLTSSAQDLLKGRFMIGPDVGTKPTIMSLSRHGAFEPLVGSPGLVPPIEIPPVIEIPPEVILPWPLCLCLVRGKVVNEDGLPICHARVHVCEVDRIPTIIGRLPDSEVRDLREDVLEALRRSTAERFPGLPTDSRFNQYLRDDLEALRPWNRASTMNQIPGLEVPPVGVSGDLFRRLKSSSVPIVRGALMENHQMLRPWLCLWPSWLHRFTCDELAVLTTDEDGRFQTVLRNCTDQPDLYFWVEYDLGNSLDPDDRFETVYEPKIPCATYWDYDCSSEVTITITDPRVPTCWKPQFTDCEVAVLSIGDKRTFAEIGPDGLVDGAPFGGRLDPRLDFGTQLRVKGVHYYQWSYQRLTDHTGAPVDTARAALARPVSWRYRDTERPGEAASYLQYPLGPVPRSETGVDNLFRVPESHSWFRFSRHDWASSYFETHMLPGADGGERQEDLAAGMYELQLRFFDESGQLVQWTRDDPNPPIDLRIATSIDWPSVETDNAPSANLLIEDGKISGFKASLRIDNNHCVAEIDKIEGGASADSCGITRYGPSSETLRMPFTAYHPNGFASYVFELKKGNEAGDPVQLSGGPVPGGDGSEEVSTSTDGLLGDCVGAAFAQHLEVRAAAHNGYGRLSGYDSVALAGFALMPAETP